MAVLKVRDENGRVYEIVALKGEKGDKGADGTVAFDSLTDEQKAALKGDKGDAPQKGVDYYTEEEKTEIVHAVIAALPNGDEVEY